MKNNKITVVSSTAKGASNFFINSFGNAMLQAATKIASKTVGLSLNPVIGSGTTTNAMPKIVTAPSVKTIPNSMVSVQPMSQPVGIVPWFDMSYEHDWSDEQFEHNILNETPERIEPLDDEYCMKYETRFTDIMGKNDLRAVNVVKVDIV